MITGLMILAGWRVWFESHFRELSPLGMLPARPLKPNDDGPGVNIPGEACRRMGSQPLRPAQRIAQDSARVSERPRTESSMVIPLPV